jgi:hypothetical protein
MFNIDFAKTDSIFRAACAGAGTPPTSRQAAKWRRSTGIAFTHGRGIAAKATQPDETLELLTVKVLRQRAHLRGIKLPSKARKADIIAALVR